MEQSPATDNKKRAIVAIAAVAILALLAAGVFALRGNEQAATTPETSDTSTAQTSNPQPVADELPATSSNPDATYKDGTYNATGSYVSPGGTERVDVSITLEGDNVTAATVEPKAATPTSTQYQGQFVAGFTQFVVGKNVDEVSVSKVSGSSLTSRGFTDALNEIKQQAKA